MAGRIIEGFRAVAGLDEEVRGGTGRIRKRSYRSTLALFGHFGSVTKFKAAHKAGFNADGKLTFSYAVDTAIALNGITQIRINMGRTVGAGSLTGATADAHFGVYLTTMPVSGSFAIAPVGQTSVHAGLSQC